MVKFELLKFATSGGKTSVVKNSDFILEVEHSNELVSQQDCVPLHTFYCISGFVGLKFSMDMYWQIRPTTWPPQSLIFSLTSRFVIQLAWRLRGPADNFIR